MFLIEALNLIVLNAIEELGIRVEGIHRHIEQSRATKSPNPTFGPI